MPSLTPLLDISYYHLTAEAALRLHYSQSNPSYQLVFAGYRPTEVAAELSERISETEIRSILIIIARLEAAFRLDYISRAGSKQADQISINLRRLHKRKKRKARLDEDILEIWKGHVDPTGRAIISKLRGMLKYRHWLAHGRYWQFGANHSFNDVYLVADVILTDFGLQS